MSSTTDPTTRTDAPTTGPASSPPSGSPLLGQSLGGAGVSRKLLPSATVGRRGPVPYVVGGALLLGAAGLLTWFLFFRTSDAKAEVLTDKVKRERLIVSVTEKGTLESARNNDIVCKVRAGTKGYASTINWVIEDGSRVNPGQLLMILDDSALKEQEDDQQIKVQTALAAKIKAEKEYEIAVKQNAKTVAEAKTALLLAEIELEKFTGLDVNRARLPLAAVAGGMAALTEDGAFRQEVDDLTGQIRLAEAEVEQNREWSAWADRMVRLTYMSAAQAQAGQSRLDSSVEKLRSLQAKRKQLLDYDRKQRLTDLVSKRDNAIRSLEQAELEADAKLVQFAAEKQRATSEYQQQDEKLRDIRAQRSECKIYAPQTIEPGSMVVYFKQESSRFSSSNQGMIEQGAQVKEGQKLLRIPNLRRMQVNTKIHEAMWARIRGDEYVPTHLVSLLQVGLQANPNLVSRAVTMQPQLVDMIRQEYRDYEYKKVADGQKARIRVDALRDRVFEGHVRVKANVASQADSWISDVKLYQTIVTIDHELLPNGTTRPLLGEELTPDMSAEVTITVDTSSEPVLTAPVTAIIGGAELGAKREVFVKTPSGYDRRPVTLGLYNEKVVEIREGLAEGDEVVLNPKVLLGDDKTTKTRDGDAKNGKGADPGKGDVPKGDTPKSPGEGGPGTTPKKGGGGKKAGGGPPGGGPPGG